VTEATQNRHIGSNKTMTLTIVKPFDLYFVFDKYRLINLLANRKVQSILEYTCTFDNQLMYR